MRFLRFLPWIPCNIDLCGIVLPPGNETSTSPSKMVKNSAFVFVKPHANTPAVRELVREKLGATGTILSTGSITGPEIDANKYIDRHYYAIASKATILPPKDIAVPPEKFLEAFGETWESALESGAACNAMQACERLGVGADELEILWRKAEKVVKFGGGFYCGKLVVEGKPPIYVFNAFFMSMRSKFVGKDDAITYFVIEWDAADLSWDKFRGELLGPTDPADAPAESIRGTILAKWEELGLKTAPNQGDNGVHASASPFEGLAERSNWLASPIEEDAFGAALIDAGLSKETIEAWSVDPRVNLPGGGMGSVFDHLEDSDADECLAKLVEINGLR